MTEDEAKTKWCPYSNPTLPNGTVSGNRDASCGGNPLNMHPDQMAATRCIGSACMAWRWRVSPQDVADMVRHSSEDLKIHGPDGHCGLAGKP